MLKYKKSNLIKFGIMGLGRVVEKRVYAVFSKELKGARVVAVFDNNIKKNKEFSLLFKCKPTKSLKDFFSRNIDMVYVATESGNHFKNLIDCFKFNKNVVVEKPPVLKLQQLFRLDKIAKRKKLHFFSIYQNRENESVKYLKKNLKKLTQNEKIIFVNLKLLWSRNQKYYSDWHGNWKMDGGVLAQQGIHYVDILCHLFGKPIKCISLMDNKINKLQAEDTHTGIVKFKLTTCTINLTTALRASDHEATIEIVTKKKIIKLYGLCCNKIKIITYDRQRNNNFNMISKKYSKEVPNGYGLSHRIVFQKIINYLSKLRSEIPLKAIETKDTLKVINMFYKSVEENKWIYNNKKNINSRLGK